MLKLLCSTFVIANVFALAGCKPREEGDLYTYFMLHPLILKQEVALCKEKNLGEKMLSTRCEVVRRAGEQMSNLIEDQQRNPQEFGQRILSAQMQSGKSGHDANEVKILLAVVGLTGPE